MGNSLRITTLASAIGIALITTTSVASAASAAPAAPGNAAKVTTVEQTNTREVYIVRFAEPGLLHYSGGSQGLTATAPAALNQRKLDVHSTASQAYGNYLQSQRSAHLQSISQAIGRSLDVTHSYLVTMNGIAAEMSLSEARKVAAVAGVTSVKRAGEQHTTTYHGPEFIGAPAIWDGSGVPGHRDARSGRRRRRHRHRRQFDASLVRRRSDLRRLQCRQPQAAERGGLPDDQRRGRLHRLRSGSE